MLLVFFSQEKCVAASEVIAAGPQPRPTMETVIITLMHLALHSEKIEFEVYMYPFFCLIDIPLSEIETLCAIQRSSSLQKIYKKQKNKNPRLKNVKCGSMQDN